MRVSPLSWVAISPSKGLQRVWLYRGTRLGPERQCVIFSDMKDDHMRTWCAARGVETYRRPSNKANATPSTPRPVNRCEHATSRVVRQKQRARCPFLQATGAA